MDRLQIRLEKLYEENPASSALVTFFAPSQGMKRGQGLKGEELKNKTQLPPFPGGGEWSLLGKFLMGTHWFTADVLTLELLGMIAAVARKKCVNSCSESK